MCLKLFLKTSFTTTSGTKWAYSVYQNTHTHNTQVCVIFIPLSWGWQRKTSCNVWHCRHPESPILLRRSTKWGINVQILEFNGWHSEHDPDFSCQHFLLFYILHWKSGLTFYTLDLNMHFTQMLTHSNLQWQQFNLHNVIKVPSIE